MNRRTRLQAVKQEPLFLLLLALGVLFFSLNLYRLAYQSLWLDECFNVLAAKQILTFGYPLYPSGHIYFKALLCSYVFAFFAALFGDTVIVFRLVSLLLYLLLPLCVYWLAKGIFHRFVLFACGLVLYLHAWEIEFARTALYYTLLQYMVTLGVLLFMARELFGRRSRYRLQWLLTGLTHQLGMALGFCFPALLVLRPRAIRRKGLLISVAVFVPFFLFVMFQEPLIWQVGHAAPVQQADGAGGVLHFFFGSFSFAYFHMLYRSHPVAATVFAAGALLLLFGLAVRLLRRLPEPNAQLLGLAFISLLLVFILLGLGFIKTHEKPRYLFAFHPIFILAVVGLLWQGLSWAAARLTRKFQPLLLALICLLALLTVDQTGPGQLWRIMHRDYDEPVQTDVITTSDRPYPIDHQRLGEYVHAQREPGDVIIAVHMLFQHHYAGRVDYWLWTGGPGTWDAWEEKDGRLRDTYLGVPMLHDVSALKAAINRHLKQGDRVWLITSPSEYNREHINWPGHDRPIDMLAVILRRRCDQPYTVALLEVTVNGGF